MKKQLEDKKAVESIYSRVREILETARSSAYRAVNFAMVQAYWHIGREIVEEEQRGKAKAGYGDELIVELSGRLTAEFGKGFTQTNLRYMRLFYLSFEMMNVTRSQYLLDQIHHAVRDESLPQQKGHAPRDELPVIRPELSWTHYRLLLKVNKPDVRRFYMEECIAANWSTRQLERQINSFYYERLLSSRDKKAVKKEIQKLEPSLKPEDIIKDPYVLEFLNVKENIRFLEKDLENALIEKLQEFLFEFGKGFSFVGRQHRIAADNDNFYIDLVFYNYLLKCFVLIDLKIGKLTHQDIGQMDFYVRYYENKIRTETDNPTIGIILCSEKNETIVKYSMLNENKRLFASKYKLYLPTEKELKEELEREKRMIEMELKLLKSKGKK
ncbi:MAG: PDDEXK nuclease domain-containing protein [Thermodesulfovibrionales bacterium]|nr:PDDEXK nuclease domain-containing protein [Thermodesulfovibrionales bacterium]